MGRGYALCIEANVVRVIDGDTLVIDRDTDGDGEDDHIRLVLVDAPESYQTGGPESKAYLQSFCDGAHALVDEDDFQVGADPYGRILAVVTCGSTNANGAMIASGHATTYTRFCSASEFQHDPWTGCP
jgi:endonuclease YncB( thermonuclease family)